MDVRAFHTEETSLLAPKGGLIITMMSLDNEDKKQLPTVPGAAETDVIR